ncbi:MAG: PEP-CTERM system histidine kinase PrsK [Burkholderiales bacterium]|nr:PEP-CTERM system histidine kinase PrsK [Burkholderiales bacterium]
MLGVPAALWSYAIGTIAYAALLAQILFGRRASRKGSLLVVAVALSVLWEASGALYALHPTSPWWQLYRAMDALRLGAWLAFVGTLLLSANGREQSWRNWPPLAFGIAALALANFAGALVPDPSPADELLASRLILALTLAVAVAGLVLVEQLMRRADEHARWATKPFCIGLGGMLAFDLFLYSDAWLFAHLNVHAWSARGLAHAVVIPLFLVAAARSRDWNIDIAISRSVVFRSTALFAAGGYLLVVSAAGYYVRFFGGAWGQTLQFALLFVALLVFGLVFTSGTIRSRVRVFVSKNFYSYRYDYREEWLRFTRALAVSESGMLFDAITRALADLVESSSGTVFLRTGDRYVQVHRWNMVPLTESLSGTESLARFLRSSSWVIDLDGYAAHPEKYHGLALPEWLRTLPDAWIVIPMLVGDDLVGFVIIGRGRVDFEINWEVLDLLKTAARQAAGVVAQFQMAEELLEARKFDAFNRMSAFVVHDLKNVVAQLSLVVTNAARHGHKPEFQKDMIETVEHAVERMTSLMLQLRSGAKPVENAAKVDLVAIIEGVCREKAQQPCRVVARHSGKILAYGHKDRLQRVLGHVVQNAIEASRSGSDVVVTLGRVGDKAVIEVTDTGVGMTEPFIRDRLFKPFQTTKASGMGIGAYESRQYLREIGGDLEVTSEVDKGTSMRIVLLAAGEAQEALHHGEVA